MLARWLVVVMVCCGQARAAKSPRPHIIVMLIDDLGWNDISFHGSPQIPTPNVDALASDGVILNKYYVLPLCSPSRSALISGKYPIHTGMQSFVIQAGEPWGLPQNIVTMPDHLKALGYSTHGVGKWHLGFCNTSYTPNSRGFDSYFGYWNGRGDYFDHTDLETPILLAEGHPELSPPANLTFWGLDLHDNMTTVRDKQGEYSTSMYTDRVVDIIRKHDQSKPLFLYIAHQAVHTANPYQWLQSPPEYVTPFGYIRDPERKMFAGMVAAMDESVGRVTEALQSRGFLDNSIIVFSTDNGGAFDYQGAVSSNWPLKGHKGTLFEGGVRGAGFLWSPLLRPRVSTQLMHISDWLPTLYHAAGGDVADLGDIDGVNMWPALSRDTPSPRKEILLNIDPLAEYSALLWRDLKVVTGEFDDGLHDGWDTVSGRNPALPDRLMDDWVFKRGSLAGSALQKLGRRFPPETSRWRQAAEVTCEPVRRRPCNSSVAPCLFNLTADPCEYNNLAEDHPEVVNALMYRLRLYGKTAVPPNNRAADPRADPMLHEFSFVPWLDNAFVRDIDL